MFASIMVPSNTISAVLNSLGLPASALTVTAPDLGRRSAVLRLLGWAADDNSHLARNSLVGGPDARFGAMLLYLQEDLLN